MRSWTAILHRNLEQNAVSVLRYSTCQRNAIESADASAIKKPAKQHFGHPHERTNRKRRRGLASDIFAREDITAIKA